MATTRLTARWLSPAPAPLRLVDPAAAPRDCQMLYSMCVTFRGVLHTVDDRTSTRQLCYAVSGKDTMGART